MKIAIIILSVLLLISILIIRLFGKIIVNQIHGFAEVEKYLNQIDFLNGGDIDEDLVLNVYKNAILIMNFIVGGNETITVWDVSQYEKNNVIGLTTFGPAQWIDEGIARLKEEHAETFEQVDEEELRAQLIEKIAEEGTIFTGVDIYQMKDGTWLWR